MTTKTASEILEQHRLIMGAELGEIYHHIYQEFYRTSCNWDHYETLFGREERVRLLNVRCPLLAYNIQQALWNQVLLSLCRLTDPANSLGRRNLSVYQLDSLVTPAHRDALLGLITSAKTATNGWRNVRNRRIAHNDLAESLGQVATALEPVTRTQITDAFRVIHRILEFVESIHYDAEPILIQTGNESAISLLRSLYDGQRYQESETRRVLADPSGTWTAYPDWLQDESPFDERYVNSTHS